MIHSKSRDAFERLYTENLDLVRGLLFNMTGATELDDLTQDVFVKVWRSLPGFSFRSSHRTWIYRIAVHVAIDHLRRRRLSSSTEDVPEPTDSTTPEGVLDDRRKGSVLQAELLKLSDEDRAMVILAYFEERPLKEIAAALEIPEGTVKSRLHAARARLKEALGKRGIHET